MQHLVQFTTAEGRPGQHTVEDLDEALRFVERLRNREGVENVRVFRLHEVPIEFRTYIKVEVRGAAADTPAPAEPALVADAGPGGDHEVARPLAAVPAGAAVDAVTEAAPRRLFSSRP